MATEPSNDPLVWIDCEVCIYTPTSTQFICFFFSNPSSSNPSPSSHGGGGGGGFIEKKKTHIISYNL